MMRPRLPFALLAGLALSAPAAEAPRRLNFANDIVPILTKGGCNGGGCHGKASGQNGFKLSLLGFEPQEDYEHIVKEAKGRRVFPPAPEQSLLVLKAANLVPHGGGKKLEPDSEEYRTLVRWISAGMPYGKPEDPVLAQLEVEPAEAVLKPGQSRQLKVTAKFSDGSTRDVTRMALYEANDKAMAETDEHGLVRTLDLPGNVAVMVRYSGKVAVFRAAIPLGAPVDSLPPEKNFIDRHVFANLQRLGIPPSALCDDSTFLRRVNLDLAGRLPTVEETQAFLTSREPDKRDRLIETLLASPEYADWFANKWTALLKNKRDAAADITANFAFHAWMRDSLLANTPYDQLVRQILASTGTVVSNPPVAWYKRVKEPTHAGRGRGSALPRRAHAMCAVSSSSF